MPARCIMCNAEIDIIMLTLIDLPFQPWGNPWGNKRVTRTPEEEQ